MNDKSDYYDYIKEMFEKTIQEEYKSKYDSIQISKLNKLDEYVSEKELHEIVESLLKRNPKIFELAIKKIRAMKIQKLDK